MTHAGLWILVLALASSQAAATPAARPALTGDREQDAAAFIDWWSARPKAEAPEITPGGVTIKVGGDADCDYSDLQEAIDAAPNGARIEVARNGVYQNQHLLIANKSLDVIGGYASCSSGWDGERTTLDGEGGTVASVIRVADTDPAERTFVVLATLDIFNGEGSGSSARSGGGIKINGRSYVVLNNVLVGSNAAHYGGGINLSTHDGSSSFPDAGLRIYNSAIMDNDSDYGIGGGINCYRSKIRMERESFIFLNQAWSVNGVGGHGGGLRLHECTLTGQGSSIWANGADASGGGIFALNSEMRLAGEYLHQLNFRVYGNSTGTAEAELFPGVWGGGGILMNTSSLIATNLAVYDNEAARGYGAGMLVRDRSLVDWSTRMDSGDHFMPFSKDNRSCDGGACNRLSGNKLASGIGSAGMDVYGAGNDSSAYASQAALRNVEVYGNEGPEVSAFRVGESGTRLELRGVLVTDNHTASEGAVVELFSSAITMWHNTTIVENLDRPGDAVFKQYGVGSAGHVANLVLEASVIAEPAGVAYDGMDAVEAWCTYAHETGTLPTAFLMTWANRDSLFYRPGLAGAEYPQGRQNYEPGPLDMPVDRCSNFTTGRDGRGVKRGYDSPLPGAGGTYDAGAFENDVIHEDGFEPAPG